MANSEELRALPKELSLLTLLEDFFKRPMLYLGEQPDRKFESFIAGWNTCCHRLGWRDEEFEKFELWLSGDGDETTDPLTKYSRWEIEYGSQRAVELYRENLWSYLFGSSFSQNTS